MERVYVVRFPRRPRGHAGDFGPISAREKRLSFRLVFRRVL